MPAPDLKKVVADNVRRRVPVVAGGNVAVTTWLIARGIDNGNVTRVLKGQTSIGLDLLAQLARVLRLSAYQLLIPDLDAHNPARLPVNEEERRLAKMLAAAFNSEPPIAQEVDNARLDQTGGATANRGADREMPGARPGETTPHHKTKPP